MKRLVISAVLNYDLALVDTFPDDYDIDELVESVRIDLQDKYEELDLEVHIHDYMVEGSDDY